MVVHISTFFSIFLYVVKIFRASLNVVQCYDFIFKISTYIVMKFFLFFLWIVVVFIFVVFIYFC